MTAERDEPRELTPVQTFWDGEGFVKGIRNYGPEVIKIDQHEEQLAPPAPKDVSVQEPVASSPVESPTTPGSPTLPPSSASPVPSELSPTEKLEAAVVASGQSNSPNGDAPPLPTTTTPQPESSSPSSSSATSPGSSELPAPVLPPPAASPPAVQTTPPLPTPGSLTREDS